MQLRNKANNRMYSKDEMINDHYKWDDLSDFGVIRAIEEFDGNKLDRKNGMQMIYYINCLGYTWNWKPNAIRAYKKLEITINDKLPPEIEEYSKIKIWIQQNFKDFWDTLLSS